MAQDLYLEVRHSHLTSYSRLTSNTLHLRQGSEEAICAMPVKEIWEFIWKPHSEV